MCRLMRNVEKRWRSPQTAVRLRQLCALSSLQRHHLQHRHHHHYLHQHHQHHHHQSPLMIFSWGTIIITTTVITPLTRGWRGLVKLFEGNFWLPMEEKLHRLFKYFDHLLLFNVSKSFKNIFEIWHIFQHLVNSLIEIHLPQFFLIKMFAPILVF